MRAAAKYFGSLSNYNFRSLNQYPTCYAEDMVRAHLKEYENLWDDRLSKLNLEFALRSIKLIAIKLMSIKLNKTKISQSVKKVIQSMNQSIKKINQSIKKNQCHLN